MPSLLFQLVLEKLIPDGTLSERQKEKLLGYIKNNHFNLLAQAIGLKVIHISERDTQVSASIKKTKNL